MPLKKDDSGRRWVEMEFLVPGTPEQVWQAIATGPGMSAWFTPTEVEEKPGGAISFDFGNGDVSSGEVTGWEPPRRMAYQEYGWSADAPPVATEVTITSRSGDRCVVRMVHSMVTDRDDWDDEIESFETGWPGFFEILRIYLADFAGQAAATVHAVAAAPAGEAHAWSTLTEALNIAGANVGDRCTSPSGPPPLAGVVERIRQDTRARDVMLRIEQPAPGVAWLGTCTVGERASASVSLFFYGSRAAEVADEYRSDWAAWLRGVLESDRVAT